MLTTSSLCQRCTTYFQWDVVEQLLNKLAETESNESDNQTRRGTISGPAIDNESEFVRRDNTERTYIVQMDTRPLGDFLQYTNKCKLCNLICYAVSQQCKSLTKLGLRLLELSVWVDLSNRRLRRISGRMPFTNPRLLYVIIYTLPIEAAEPFISFDYSRPMSSTDTLEWLSRSLTDCLNNHNSCREGFDPSFLPTRLIDVGDSESSELRIVLSATIASGKYVTLSHKWGLSRFTTLRTSNIDVLKKGFEMNSLPRSFREAILICRSLQIRYLWIDSLCILQDSEDDWRKESSTMSLIYSNSLCNIAASKADGAEQGLEIFNTRHLEPLTPLRVKAVSQGSQKEYVCFLRLVEIWEALLSQAPLYQRGWVLQERLLSPRTMHLSTPALWECRQRYACERYLYKKCLELAVDKVWSSMPPRWSIKQPYQALWENIIRQYSCCALTIETDKLVAISGIARVMHLFIGGDYLAGLWRTHLVRGLMWMVCVNDISGKYASRPVKYRAPSWSWASINGPIFPDLRPDDNQPSYVQILYADTIPRSPNDPFGQVFSGYIELRGKLTICGPVILAKLQHSVFVSEQGPEAEHFIDDSADVSTNANGDVVSTYFLPLAHVENSYLENWSHYVMLLRPARRPSPNTYERIGCVFINAEGEISGTDGLQYPGWTAPPWPDEELQTVRII